jgi:hypothetical protein
MRTMTIPESPKPTLPDDPDLPDKKEPPHAAEPTGSRVFTLMIGQHPNHWNVASSSRRGA